MGLGLRATKIFAAEFSGDSNSAQKCQYGTVTLTRTREFKNTVQFTINRKIITTGALSIKRKDPARDS